MTKKRELKTAIKQKKENFDVVAWPNVMHVCLRIRENFKVREKISHDLCRIAAAN